MDCYDFSDANMKKNACLQQLLYLPRNRRNILASCTSTKQLSVSLLQAERTLLKCKHANKANTVAHAKGHRSALQRVGRGKRGFDRLLEMSCFDDYYWDSSDYDIMQEELVSKEFSSYGKKRELTWLGVKAAFAHSWDEACCQMTEQEHLAFRPEAFLLKQKAAAVKVLAPLHLHICNAISGSLLCKVVVSKDASIFEIKNAICCSIGMPPAFQVLFVGGDELTCDQALGLSTETPAEIIIVSLLRRGDDQCDDVAMKALLEMQALHCKHVPEILSVSRVLPTLAWQIVAAFNNEYASPSSMIAAVVAKNGSEQAAKNAIDMFACLALPNRNCLGRWRHQDIVSNRHAGGHGTYREWLHRHQNTYFDTITRSTWLLSRAGFEGWRAIMQAFDSTLKLAGNCQKALLLCCAANVLPLLSESEATTCAQWITKLLKHTSAEIKVCAALCLQRIMAGHKINDLADLAALLHDEEGAVRHAAIVALGCCGRRAAPFVGMLVTQLEDACARVRYAALVTMGCLQGEARPYKDLITSSLHDPCLACRCAALRTLSNIGAFAPEHIWIVQQIEIGRSGAIAGTLGTVERLFRESEVPFPQVFSGRAPLGKNVGLPFASMALDSDANIHIRSMCVAAARKQIKEFLKKISKFETLPTPCSKNRSRRIHKLRCCQEAWKDVLRRH